MAKLTIDQRIAKVNSQIQKEEEAIQESKEKIKKLTAELKLLTAEKEQSFANDIIKNGCMDKNKICICCSKCTEIMRTKGGTPGCVIRDKEVYMPIYKKQCGGIK